MDMKVILVFKNDESDSSKLGGRKWILAEGDDLITLVLVYSTEEGEEMFQLVDCSMFFSIKY